MPLALFQLFYIPVTAPTRATNFEDHSISEALDMRGIRCSRDKASWLKVGGGF